MIKIDWAKLKATRWWDFLTQLVRDLDVRHHPNHKGSALQCEHKADSSRSYTCTKDNDNDNGNTILLYHPLTKIKPRTSPLCLALDNARRGRWARLEWRLSWGWAGCSLLWGHVRLQAVCPEEAFSAVLGVMKKYGCELNPPRNDEITLFIFTFVLMNRFHLFSVGMNGWPGVLVWKIPLEDY